MPHRLTLKQMVDNIRCHKLSPTELVDAHIAQIEHLNPQLNAFVMQFPSEARAAARRASLESPSTLLHGIPITVKDSFDIAGLPTLCGSRFRLSHRASHDSTAVARLKAAGAIILGKTNCPEFLGNYESDNHITGRTNNPWDLDRTAGGSSGGESAAIAAYCSAGGIGSDGGGSIRIPAHFCGIAGLKPTPGRVPATGHFPEISHPGGLLGVAGPMARTAEDVRLLFEVVAGFDPHDPFSAPVPLRLPVLDGIKVGFVGTWGGRTVDPAVERALDKAAAALRELRFPVQPFESQGFQQCHQLWWFFFGELVAPLKRILFDGNEAKAHWTGTEFVDMVPRSRSVTAAELLDKLGARDRLRTRLIDQMRDTPVLLTPVCGIPAFRHRERQWPVDGGHLSLLDAMAQSTPFNLLGLPAVTIPFDITPNGLPVGIQLVGRPYDEELLLELAVRLERVRGPFPHAPVAGLD